MVTLVHRPILESILDPHKIEVSTSWSQVSLHTFKCDEMEYLGPPASFILSLYSMLKMVLHRFPLPALFSVLPLAYFDCLGNPGLKLANEMKRQAKRNLPQPPVRGGPRF